MIDIRKADERGHANHGWLDSHHTFSFASYYDPAHMGFRDLRVINEDRVAPGAGFGEHPHRDMEIISYVIDGALEHRDSMGNSSVIKPGEIQRMSAGTGVVHSEYNHSRSERVHFLQIWIETAKKGIQPGYEQKRFDNRLEPGKLTLIAANDGRADAITVHQDVNIYAGKLSEGNATTVTLPEGRHAWVQVVRGELVLEGHTLSESDGAAISNLTNFGIKATTDSEFLVFDLT